MDIKLHKQAITTPKIRAGTEAAPSSITDSELARGYGLSGDQVQSVREVCKDVHEAHGGKSPRYDPDVADEQ